MFLIPIEGRVSIASGMTWYQDARRALKIDWEIFLRMVIVMVAIGWPLMLIVRMVVGASLLGAVLNILSLTLVLSGVVMLGVFLFGWLHSHSSAYGLRRWAAGVLYGVLLVTAIGAQG